MPPRLLDLAGVEICVEEFGNQADPTVLLITGAAASMLDWDQEFCERLAAGRRHVVRYDHRDTGGSSKSEPGKPDYTGDALVMDSLHVLDALEVERAHIVGLSMGGGIAQDLALVHPARVLSLTLIATTAAVNDSAFDDLPGMTAEAAAEFAAAPEASHNHFAMEQGTTPSVPLDSIGVPTLVIHGTDDPFFPLPHGETLATRIPGARLLVLDGVGHEPPPPPSYDVVVPAILELTNSASA